MADCKNLDLAREWAEMVRVGRTVGPNAAKISAAADLISSLPDQWVDAEKLREVVADHHIDMSEELMEALGDLLPATPRPEDVPVGEPWQVEVDGKAAIGYRNAPGATFPWATIRDDEPAADYCIDADVTLIARLVPETTEQDDTEEDDEKVLDPAYTYRDKDGDTWEFLNRNWRCADYGDSATNYLIPPAEYGPYTRIEDTNE